MNNIVCLKEPEKIEEEIAEAGAEKVLKIFYTSFGLTPLLIREGVGFKGLDVPAPLPSWLSDEYLDHCVAKFNKSGFTGGINYYRATDL